MLNGKQLTTLFCSGICYALTLYSFLRMDSWIFLICFILHSIFLMLFSIFCYTSPKAEDNGETAELTERIVNIKSEWKEESEQLKSQLSEKEQLIEDLKKSEEALTQKTNELTEKVRELDLELASKEQSVREAFSENSSSILPEFLPGPSASTTVNIIDVAKSVAREFFDDAAKAGLTISVSSSDEALLVKADQNMLRILFRNIVDNSIKYMNRHGSLIITISNVADEIFVVCKDTGEGLPEDETRHIFELNYQGSNRISGNGLGLYQAKAIVTYYGGTIYAKSTTGKGMGIYIQLPTT